MVFVLLTKISLSVFGNGDHISKFSLDLLRFCSDMSVLKNNIQDKYLLLKII